MPQYLIEWSQYATGEKFMIKPVSLDKVSQIADYIGKVRKPLVLVHRSMAAKLINEKRRNQN